MTQDEIIEMAKEAGLEVDGVYFSDTMYRAVLVRFANLVAAKERDRIANEAKDIIKRAEARGAVKEREVCAKVAEHSFGAIGSTIALAIRARGEA
jgi:hypothetical protein